MYNNTKCPKIIGTLNFYHLSVYDAIFDVRYIPLKMYYNCGLSLRSSFAEGIIDID